MSTYRSTCGCEIHVAQWTSKRKIASLKNCAVHKAAPELLAACKAAEPLLVGALAFVDCNKQLSQLREAIKSAEEDQ